MARNDPGGRSRLRQMLWIVLAVGLFSVLFLHHQGGRMQRAFSAFGQPGYVVPRAQVASLRQGAPYLRVPRSLGGLPLNEALTHPAGIAGHSSFIEILYGSASGAYLDLAQSDIALEIGQRGHAATVSSLRVREGVAQLGGKRRRFAAGRVGSTYFLLVGPVGSHQFAPALGELSRLR